MASSALTEKINKIRQLNEEIKRRHEEVEEDKKNAAKQNALVQMVPSTDWPERKEPPEFTNSPKTKQKPTKEKHEYVHPQSHSGEGRKIHSFAQGEGPPPDPKYNFLADSEREEPTEHTKETVGNRSSNKASRGSFRKKIGGRENIEKDNKINKGNYKDESQSGYDAWRAERNRIDEDRISRQRTAEGNWLREWDNDKFITHRNDEFERDLNREHAPTQYYSERLENSAFPKFSRTKKKYKDSGRRYDNNNEHANYNQGGNHRPYRGSAKNVHGNHDNRSHAAYNQHRNNVPTSAKSSESPTSEERTVIATEKSLKVTVNQSSLTKGPVMSIKVNSPSIAGTGRVGPRQRTRVTYSHSDVDSPTTENESFFRQKSFEDKSKGTFFGNQKFSNVKRSHSQRKKDSDSRPPHYQRKEDSSTQKYHDNEFRSYSQKDQQKSYSAKSPKPMRASTRVTKHESSNVNISQKCTVEECSTTNETNAERNVTTEHSESLQVTESEQTETPITESSEMDIGNKTTNETIPKKETEEALPDSLSGTESSEHIDKDSTKKIDSDNENKGLEEVANNSTEDVQENNTSSETNNTQSEDTLGLNENNEESNDVIESKEIVASKDDQLPVEQITEQSGDANCKDTENQLTAQQTVDNSEPPLETKTLSVIEINDQSVCNKDQVQEEKANENDESSDKISKDTVSSNEINPDTVSDTKTSIHSTEEEKKKSEEIINEKIESTEGL